MDKLNLTTQSRIQLAILQAEEEQNIKNISRIILEANLICRERAGMSFNELMIHYNDRLDRLDAINTEIELMEESLQ